MNLQHEPPKIEPESSSSDTITNSTTQKITKNTTASTTGSMLRLSLCVSFSAWISNFDNGYSGTVLIMPSYKHAFGSCEQVLDPNTYAEIQHCSLTPLQQSLISLNFLFIAIGGGIAGVTGQYIGRRGSIQAGCALAIIGAAGMLGTSGSFLRYMVCRSISAVGIGQLMAASVTYGSECIVANKRGLSLGLYNVGLAGGNVGAFAVCAGSARLEPTNDWQWKTPILCQIPLGVILGAGILMLPESPRWLMGHGREEEARKSFGVLYNQSPYSPEITAQIDDIRTNLATERVNLRAVSCFDIYRRKHIVRTMTSAMIMVGIAITGIQFVQPYATLFLKGVGISDPYLINVIIGLCILGGSFLGPFIVEYGGRRIAMIWGYTVMAACMLALSSVSTALGMDETADIVTVVLLCLWAFVFGATIAASANLSSVEMHSVSLRTFGQANTTIFYGIFAFGATFWTPYMLGAEYGNMGPNVGYFYAGVTAVIGILTFLFVPETAGITLEQIDEGFNSGIKAWKTSLHKNRAIASSQQRIMAGGKVGA
ncbi:Major facilitator superfamily domain, general substrate transporter [Penicillium expansum]|uniref:Major facilitator superfamily domain, general substrate transporter n=1 Tax=Penicillium expansum TaxID=27334 RepID=A0A0A2KUS1_PENEN|nr:Major facilitator superfamily domain, general substrate transporter [Penicillium expansum]KGO45654.1 Major facilitator superfamily domain, general substrate transporter [Penicillium expansum]KGO62848.1 Major facilitator superfamily domain, general substrate transporter [Penicillium expansum]KGO70641.1 Major facilitator superfamily domain, general substrate transporter [Penicillium expansum]